jgi:hypothetical protein
VVDRKRVEAVPEVYDVRVELMRGTPGDRGRQPNADLGE